MTELRLVDTPGELDTYLSFLFDGLEGYVHVALADRDPNHEVSNWEQKFFEWPKQRIEVETIIQNETLSRDVYVCPAMLSEPSTNREAFLSSNVVWTELDDRRALQVEGLRTGDWSIYNCPMPSLRIQSGWAGNEHWYWRLNDPITEASDLEGINRALCNAFGADQSGWDATQVLRPPQTLNHKRDKLVTQILTISQEGLNETAFQRLTPVVRPELIDRNTIPEALNVLLKYPFGPKAIELFRSTPGEGDRSTALMSLGYLCAEMGMTDGEVFSLIRNADDRWGKFRGRRDRDTRLSDLIAKVRIKVPTRLGVSELDNLRAYGLKSLMETEVVLNWLVPDVLEAGGYMLLTGPSGVGKTQWSLQWAIHLALGRSFLDSTITVPRKVVFFSLEMGIAPLKYFLTSMIKDYSEEDLELLESNLTLLPIGESLYLDGQEHQTVFEKIMMQFKPDLVFIDSLGSSTQGDLNEQTVKSIMDFNDRVRSRYGCATWYIHHNRKAQADNRKPNKLSDVYGGQYIVNRATSVFCLWPDKSGLEVIELKKRLAPLGSNWRIQRTANLNFIRLAEVTLGTTRKEIEYKQQPHPVVDREGFEVDEKPTPPPPTKLTGGM